MDIEVIFGHYLHLKRFKAVALEVNAVGMRTQSGGLHTGQTIKRILTDPANQTKVGKGIWEQVQIIIKHKPTKRSVAHLCSGLLRCGCGSAMYVPSRSRKYVCGHCRRKIAKDDLETIILEEGRVQITLHSFA